MRGVEGERPFSAKYWRQLPKEVFGIGYSKRLGDVGPRLFDFPEKEGRAVGGIAGFFDQFSAPLAVQTLESRRESVLLPALLLDIASVSATIALAINGEWGWAAVTKLGYNTIAQIAPDAVRLIKNRMPQKASK